MFRLSVQHLGNLAEVGEGGFFTTNPDNLGRAHHKNNLCQNQSKDPRSRLLHRFPCPHLHYPTPPDPSPSSSSFYQRNRGQGPLLPSFLPLQLATLPSHLPNFLSPHHASSSNSTFFFSFLGASSSSPTSSPM